MNSTGGVPPYTDMAFCGARPSGYALRAENLPGGILRSGAEARALPHPPGLSAGGSLDKGHETVAPSPLPTPDP